MLKGVSPNPAGKLTPEMLVERVKVFDVNELALMEGNPNQGDIGAVHESMSQFGQINTILVVDGTVVDGNHRVMAERQAPAFGGKLAGIDATGLDLDAVRAMAMGLALNRTARLGHDDPGLLSQALLRMKDDEALLQAVGYTLDDLDDLLELANGDMPDLDGLAGDGDGDGDGDEAGPGMGVVKFKAPRRLVEAWEAHAAEFGDDDTAQFAALLAAAGVQVDDDDGGEPADPDAPVDFDFSEDVDA